MIHRQFRPGDGAADSPPWYPGNVLAAPPRTAPGHDAPNNVPMEAELLGTLLTFPEAFAAVADGLRPDHFWRTSHRIVYAAMLRLDAQGLPATAVAVADAIRARGESYLVDQAGDADRAIGELLERCNTPANAPYYADVIRGKAVGRKLLESAYEVIDAVRSEAFSPDELIAHASKGVAEAESDLPRSGSGAEALPPGFPESPDAAAYAGLAGEFVAMVGPHTEADPVALLVQFLTMVGNVVGRRPHWRVEASKHHLNLFTCVVGISSQGRKGTSYDQVRRLFEELDPDWLRDGIRGGMSSGEGLIDAIKDPVYKRDRQSNYESVMIDPGVEDKRALWLESEFGSVLDVASREGNTLSAVLRKAWDGSALSSSTKGSPVHATDPHVSIIGHVTFFELTGKLSSGDLANGFANRFLWACVRRSKMLPHGGNLHAVDFTDFRARLAAAVAWARDEAFGPLQLRRDDAANALWESAYPELTSARPGVLGSVCSRGAAQAMRLAAIYAVLDRSPWIGRRHLEAGLAVWRYAEASATYIFGQTSADPDERKVHAAIRAAGPAGLSTSAINRRCYSGHRKSDALARTLAALVRDGLIRGQEDAQGDARRRAVLWIDASVPAGEAPGGAHV